MTTKKDNYSHTIFKNGAIVTHDSEVEGTYDYLPPGFYKATINRDGSITNTTEQVDILEPIVTPVTKKVMNAYKSFLKDSKGKEIMKNIGKKWKMNVLLHSDGGEGKTTLINYLSDTAIKAVGARVFICGNLSELRGAQSVINKERLRGDENLVILILDEFEQLANEHPSEIKSLLDGNDSIENSTVFAATNKIDQIKQKNSAILREQRFRIKEEMLAIEDEKVKEDFVQRIIKKSKIKGLEPKTILDKIPEGKVTVDAISTAFQDYVLGLNIGEGEARRKIGFVKDDSSYSHEEGFDDPEEFIEFFLADFRDLQKTD